MNNTGTCIDSFRVTSCNFCIFLL